MYSSLKRWSETICCALGVGLSFHLGLLKQFSLPCIGAGGCHSIIHSGYGAIFGLPVGYYGALFWSAAILVDDRTKRGALLLLIAVGAAVFMMIQFFVLRGFCLYCTAHAVVAFIAVILHAESPRRSALPIGLALAVAGFGLARSRAANVPMPFLSLIRSDAPLATAPSGVPWLGPLTQRSPALILSLNCAACVDVLEEISHHGYNDVHTGPAIFFKTSDENRELTIAFVSAVLAQNEPKRDAFLAMTALFLSIKDLALSSPQNAATQFNRLVPSAASQRLAAIKLLNAQAQTLTALGLGDTTPLIVPIVGRPRPIFKLEELFGH